MPSTLLDVGSGALTAIGQLGQGQSASPEDGAQVLRYANLLLSQWSTQRLFLYYVAIRSYVLQANVADYTLGPSGTLVAARPTFVESFQVQVGGSTIWLPGSMADKQKWDALVTKGAVDDIPTVLYVEYGFPNLTLHFNPAPRATPSFRLGTWEQLTQFTSLFDTIQFPPAYEEFLESSLAIMLAPYYDQPVPQSLQARQAKAEMDVMKINAQSIGGSLGPAQLLQSPNVGQPIPSGGPQ